MQASPKASRQRPIKLKIKRSETVDELPAVKSHEIANTNNLTSALKPKEQDEESCLKRRSSSSSLPAAISQTPQAKILPKLSFFSK